ncbi:MAG TPA: sporulation transcriptional regulator SpoIIID [Bacillota bacterium]
MKEYIWRRVIDIGRYIVRTHATVREAAGVFGVSKSTVHKDVTERLPKIDPELAAKAKRVLDLNKAERHIRGGEATRKKYRGATRERRRSARRRPRRSPQQEPGNASKN